MPRDINVRIVYDSNLELLDMHSNALPLDQRAPIIIIIIIMFSMIVLSNEIQNSKKYCFYKEYQPNCCISHQQ